MIGHSSMLERFWEESRKSLYETRFADWAGEIVLSPASNGCRSQTVRGLPDRPPPAAGFRWQTELTEKRIL